MDNLHFQICARISDTIQSLLESYMPASTQIEYRVTPNSEQEARI